MSVFSLITLILGIVEPILAQSKLIPSDYQGLASGILNAITAIKNELTGSNGQFSVTAITLLQAINSGMQALNVAGALPAGVSGISSALAGAAEAGVLAYQQSQTKVDPTQLQPIAPVK
jgi:hypothetical protein